MSQSKISSLNKLSDKKFDLEIEKIFKFHNIKFDENIAKQAKTLIKFQLSSLEVKNKNTKKDIAIFIAITLSAILMFSTIYGFIIGSQNIQEIDGLKENLINDLRKFNCTLSFKNNTIQFPSDYCNYNEDSWKVNNDCPAIENINILNASCLEKMRIIVGLFLGVSGYAVLQLSSIFVSIAFGVNIKQNNKEYKNDTASNKFFQKFQHVLGSHITASTLDIYTFRRALAGKKQDEKEVSLLDMPAEILLMIESYLLPQNAEKAISTLFFVDNLMMGPINKIIEKKDNPYFKLLKSIADKFTKTHESDNDHVQIIIEDKEEKKPAIETTSLLQKQSAKTSSKYNSIQ